MEKVLTTTALWQDFDPAAEPLDINVLKTVEEDGVTIKTVYFTGRTVADGKTRVLAKVCTKVGKASKTAVLLIDNYKKPIDESELKFWANNGFVAMAVDFAGRRAKGACTLYPFSLDYCNADVAQSYFYVGENAKQTKIYEYAVSCMRAITYLLLEEKAKTVSVVTIKKGVSVGSVVIGTDNRIANGTIVFGSLQRDYPAPEHPDKRLGELEGQDLVKRVEYEQRRQMWTAGIAPQSYAMQTKVPVYVIVSSNSPHVSFLGANKMYSRLNEQSRMLLLPSSLDYLPDEYVQGVIKWCKGTAVEPATELVQETVGSCNNYVKIVSKLPQSKITLWYSRNAQSRARNWVKAPLKKTEDGYIAELDVYSEKSDLIMFAVEKGVVTVSTPMSEIKVTKPTKIKIPTRSVYAGNNDDNLVPLVKGSGWHGNKNIVEYCKGYLDIYGAKGLGMATFAVNDPCVRHRETFTVSFDICCTTAQPLKVGTVADFGSKNLLYKQTVQLTGDGKWQRITLEGSRFHSDDGRQMPDDCKVEVLTFEADKEFIVNNIFLV